MIFKAIPKKLLVNYHLRTYYVLFTQSKRWKPVIKFLPLARVPRKNDQSRLGVANTSVIIINNTDHLKSKVTVGGCVCEQSKGEVFGWRLWFSFSRRIRKADMFLCERITNEVSCDMLFPLVGATKQETVTRINNLHHFVAIFSLLL